MTATITVVQSRTVQSDSECVFHGYGTPLDISAEDVCFYVSFYYCVSPCPGELPGPGGKRKCGTPSDGDTGQPKGSDAGLLRAGISDAVSTQKEAKAAAPGRRKATSGDKGAQKAKKARVAPKGK